MAPQEKLIPQVRELLFERGQKALELARQLTLEEDIPFKPLQEALQFFICNWEDVLHPALLSLACEAVGGNSDATTNLGAALVLLAGGADVHDDVIDQSATKDSKPTVMGEFGKDIAILVGDALLLRGLYALHEACEVLTKNEKQAILELTKQAFFDISSAEARETILRGKLDSAEEYLEMIKMKAAVGELTTKIGAILGGGTLEEIDVLGQYGKTLAILYTIRDEFIDTYELDELRNRIKRECLPLPVLFTLKNLAKADKIKPLLESNKITEKDARGILDLSIDSKETRELKRKMRLMKNKINQRLYPIKQNRNKFMLLLESMMEDL